MLSRAIFTYFVSVLVAAALLISASFNGVGANPYVLAMFCTLIYAWLVTSILSAKLIDRISIPSGWLPLLMVVYMAWITLNPSISVLPQSSWLQGLVLGSLPVAFFALHLDSSDTPDRRWRHFTIGFTTSGVILSIWGVGIHLMDGERAHGPLIDANAFAAVINLCLIPLIYDFLRKVRPFHRSEKTGTLLALGAVTIMTLANLLTFSRGALLTLLIGSTAAIVLQYRNRNLHFGRMLLLILVVITAYTATRSVSYNSASNMLARDLSTIAVVTSPQGASAVDSAWRERLLLWSSTRKMIQDGDIVFGYGLGTFKTLFPPYRHPSDGSAGNHAHNDYLQALAEGGILQFAFLILITLVAPLWLLFKSRSQHKHDSATMITPDRDPSGLIIAILCTSVHATINFIFSILPISMLIGLYLARTWETSHALGSISMPESLRQHIRPAIVRIIFLTGITVPFGAVIADTLVVASVAGGPDSDALVWKVPQEHQVPLINTLIALRPGNPLPREILVLHLISVAESAASNDSGKRDRMLAQAEQEAQTVARLAPAGPSWLFLMAKIHMTRATKADLNEAANYLFEAQRRAPQNVLVRRELVSCLTRMGLNRQAFEAAQQHRPWLLLTTSLPMLAELSNDALPLARRYGTENDIRYWATIRSHLLHYLEEQVAESKAN